MKRSGSSLLLLGLLLLTVLACQALTPGQGALSGSDLYMRLRDDALHMTSGPFGLQLDPGSTVPYGVLMDNVIDSQLTSTLTSFSSGDASLLLNSGNGRRDGGSLPGVRTAAKNLYLWRQVL